MASWSFQGSCQAEVRTKNLWWAPDAVTVGGHKTDQLLTFIFVLTTVVFVAVNVVYVYFLVKYRRRRGVKAVYSHGNNSLELVWTLIPAAVFIGLAVYSNHIWKELRSEAPADSLRIDIVAHQYGWFIRYPGADDKLGGYDQKLMTRENTFGTMAGAPEGRDDFTSGDLVIPTGRPVNVLLRSQDVIHAFYVPEFRMYQDAVPGREIKWVWFTVEKTGNYQLACSQLCGSGHYNMKANIKVVTPEEFRKWTEEKSKLAVQEADKKDKEKAAQAAAAAQPATAAAPASPTDPAVVAVTTRTSAAAREP